jgi:hypothetical protein
VSNVAVERLVFNSAGRTDRKAEAKFGCLKKNMNNLKSWVGRLTALVITGLVASIAVLVANQHLSLGEIIKVRPVAILVGTTFISLLGGALILWRLLDSRFGNDLDPRERAARREREFDVVKITIITTIAVVVGWYLITVASAYADKEMQEVAVRTATGWAMAYFAGAFLVGFLFGIPKVIEDNGEKNVKSDVAKREWEASSASYAQRVNTNLEQISDWLTKIIVGLGLVELRKMPDHLHRAAAWMATSISSKTNSELEQGASFCCAFIIFFSVTGFLAGYLLTRLFLAAAFRRADSPPKITERKITESTSRNDSNAQRDVQRIHAFWKPENKINKAAEEKIMSWLQKRGLYVSVPLFIRDAEYAKERAELIKEVVENNNP